MIRKVRFVDGGCARISPHPQIAPKTRSNSCLGSHDQTLDAKARSSVGEVTGGLNSISAPRREPQCCCRQSRRHEPIPQQPIHVFSGGERRAIIVTDRAALYIVPVMTGIATGIQLTMGASPIPFTSTINRTRLYSNR